MSTTSISSLLSALNPGTNGTLAELLGESNTTATTSSSQNSALQTAVNAILNSATNTSGSGIDVTSTVDAILELDAAPEINLQNQVTALNSQTSALQTIENDLASLQTAVQALNDPMGAFSAVAVTSSNNDVVSATAANGTAAGSHTITVKGLATTSAAYSAPQTSSTSALPVGEFDLQVGDNTAVPIPVDSADNTDTLTGLATYINQQNMGVTASVITDASGARLSLVGQTSGTAGVITISNDTTGADLSGSFSSASAALPTGSFYVQVGSSGSPVQIPVDTAHNTDTLTGLASYINSNVSGVTASVITNATGAQLALVPKSSGSAGEITISSDTTGSSGNGMGFPSTYTPPTVQGMGFTMVKDSNGNLASDASLSVDGIPITSGSNTVTGVIPGVTLTLSGTSSSPVTLAVQPDLTQVATAVNNFISAWNQTMNDINTQNTYSGSGTAPPLLGDPSLDLLQSQLLNDITTSLNSNGAAVNLQSIGIHLQADGTLTTTPATPADSMDLNDALTNDFSAVQNLFQSTSPAGVAQTLNTDLTNLTDAVNGPLNLDMSSISSEVTDLNSQITDFQYQLQQTQAQLTTQYSTINTTLEQLPELLAQVNDQLNALNPPSNA
jgi:flagellar hook-associated protein 2